MGFLGMLQQACAGGNAVYTEPMSKMILIATGALLLLRPAAKARIPAIGSLSPAKAGCPLRPVCSVAKRLQAHELLSRRFHAFDVRPNLS